MHFFSTVLTRSFRPGWRRYCRIRTGRVKRSISGKVSSSNSLSSYSLFSFSFSAAIENAFKGRFLRALDYLRYILSEQYGLVKRIPKQLIHSRSSSLNLRFFLPCSFLVFFWSAVKALSLKLTDGLELGELLLAKCVEKPR